MPKNLRADIEWHKARIAFYTQKLEELEAAKAPDTESGQADTRAIIADLRRTLGHLESALAHLDG